MHVKLANWRATNASRVIEIDRVVNRVGRRNQKRIWPMRGHRRSIAVTDWLAAGLRGSRALIQLSISGRRRMSIR